MLVSCIKVNFWRESNKFAIMHKLLDPQLADSGGARGPPKKSYPPVCTSHKFEWNQEKNGNFPVQSTGHKPMTFWGSCPLENVFLPLPYWCWCCHCGCGRHRDRRTRYQYLTMGVCGGSEMRICLVPPHWCRPDGPPPPVTFAVRGDLLKK